MESFVNIAILIIFLTGTVLLRCFAKVSRCFFQRGFIKVIASILLTLFALISFFFSLHAGILSQQYKPVNSTESNTNDFNRLLPYFIIKYPIDQLKNHDSHEPVIINNTSNEMEDVNYIFVVDKSKKTSIQNRILEELRNQLIDNAKSNEQSCTSGSVENYVQQLEDITDLFLMHLVNQLYKIAEKLVPFFCIMAI